MATHAAMLARMIYVWQCEVLATSAIIGQLAHDNAADLFEMLFGTREPFIIRVNDLVIVHEDCLATWGLLTWVLFALVNLLLH